MDRCRRISSSSDDDVPLKCFKSNITGLCDKRNKCNSDLQTYHRTVCDFCDRIFYNRYDILVHNASHIIIPLLKQTLHQCKKCLYHFTSEAELDLHTSKKHSLHSTANKSNVPEVFKDIFRKEPVVALDKDESLITTYEKRKSVSFQVKDENDDVRDTKGVAGHVGMKIEYSDDYILPDPAPSKTVPDICDTITPDICDTITPDICDRPGLTENSGRINIIKKIVFEDDADDISPFSPNGVFDTTADFKEKSTPLANSIGDVCGVGQYTNIPLTQQWDRFDSVHYDELIRPGVFMCKRCKRTFPNRYETIVHETSHFKPKRRKPRYCLCQICERYIAGNYHQLRKHMMQKHEMSAHEDATDEADRRPNKRCDQCGLLYMNYRKHQANHHEHADPGQPHKDQAITDTNGTKPYVVSSLAKMCELCFLLLRNTVIKEYICVTDLNEVDKQPCSRCDKRFTELKLVQVRHRKRPAHERALADADKKRKTITNKERLKNIRHRLKRLSLLSKY